MAELKDVIPEVIPFLTDTLRAERAMVVYEGMGITHGLPQDNVWQTAELSHTVFQTLLEEREPIVMFDAIGDPRYGNQTSALLSGLRSILFLPLYNPVGRMAGFVYADNRTKTGAFEQTHLQMVSTYVEDNYRPALWNVAPDAGSSEIDWDKLQRVQWL